MLSQEKEENLRAWEREVETRRAWDPHSKPKLMSEEQHKKRLDQQMNAYIFK